MYQRYGLMADRILQMEYEEGYEFVFFAINKIQEEKLFQRWIAGYQYEMSFDEFKSKARASASNNDNIPETEEEAQDIAVEILGKVKDILRKDR